MNYATLAALDAAHTSAMTAADAAAYLDDPANGPVRYNQLSGHDIRGWAAQNVDDWESLEADAADATSATRGASRVALKLLDDSASILDLNEPLYAGMVASLLATGVMSQAGRDALYAMAAEYQQSLAAANGLGYVRPGDVEHARSL